MQPYFNNLPSEILNQIFSHFLTSKKEVCSLLCVDKTINKLITDFFIIENNNYFNEVKVIDLEALSLVERNAHFSNLQQRIYVHLQVFKNKETQNEVISVDNMMLTQKLMNCLSKASDQMTARIAKSCHEIMTRSANIQV